MDATVIASGVASGGNGLDGNGERDVRDTDHKAAGSSALSIADRVVTEYEKLLEALPTMARHMGKLQGDTEVMAEGEKLRSILCQVFDTRDIERALFSIDSATFFPAIGKSGRIRCARRVADLRIII